MYKCSIANLEGVDIATSNFCKFINQAWQRTFDLKEINVRKRHGMRPAWFDQECRRKRAEAVKAGERAITGAQISNLMDICGEYRAFKQNKLRCFGECCNLINETLKNDKLNIWKVLNKITPSNTDINMPNGDKFYNHFNQLSNLKRNEAFDYQYDEKAIKYLEDDKSTISPAINPIEFDILNRNFTASKIKSSILSLKSNKAPGIDYIPAEFLKAGVDIISYDIAELFNYLIEDMNFPERWAIGLRSPIYKSGIKIDTNNYRGITVLSVFEKIFEISVQRRLEFVSEAFGKNDRYNGGFLKGSRTSDNIFI